MQSPEKKRSRYQREVHPEEAQIMTLKLHLDKLQRERQYKNAALAARNALLLDRDVVALELYRSTHKTDDELWLERVDEHRREQAAERLAFERGVEAPMRAMGEEEEALERMCVNHMNSLSFNKMVVDRNQLKFRREERIRQERESRQRTAEDALLRSQQLLAEGWQELATAIDREERAARRAVTGRAGEAADAARQQHSRRVAFEAAEATRLRVEAEAQRERDADAEVAAMYAAYEGRLQKLSTRFGDTNRPLSPRFV